MDYRIQQLEQITLAFQEKFSALSLEELNWKSKDDTWSIAQNIEHIIIINQSYFPILARIRSGIYRQPFMAKSKLLSSFFGNAILKSVRPDRKKKSQTFAIWEPSQQPSENILQEFGLHQAILKEKIKESQDLIQQGIIIVSPANKNIPYSLDKAFDILISHELRHFNQAKGVLVQMELKKKH